MDINKNVLISVDGSEASMRAVSYVADMMGAHEALRVHLLHVLPPIPPELLEFGGSENPEQEQRLSEELKRAQSEWIDRTKMEGEPIFDQARTILLDSGMSPDFVQTEFCTSIHRPDVVRDVLEAAHKWNCGTIVVGRHSFPWLKEKLGHHVAEDLVRKGQGFTMWVIE